MAVACDAPLVTAHCEHAGGVPFPLPREPQEQPAEVHHDVESLEAEEVQQEGRTALQRASGVAQRGAAAARDRARGALVGAYGAVERRTRDSAFARDSARLAKAFPDLVQDGEKLHSAYLCDCWNGCTAKAMSGKLLLTDRHLLFHAEGVGRFSVSWADVVSLQKAVELRSTTGAPFFLSIPDPSVRWNALQVFLSRGRLYQFYRFRGGALFTADHPETLRCVYRDCDAFWRAAVDVKGLVSMRSDWQPRVAAFEYGDDDC
eukprot:TRINITY_DN30691_c0_g1_i1.p1 TRINITY_DN30691_c0_g1~~TRINITY_DN30691_c0_g1_i1.p1  ORF type:complete len:261 (+),score=58.66 TRINITY_DN30691_c0_g1_i1:78-860(+)